MTRPARRLRVASSLPVKRDAHQRPGHFEIVDLAARLEVVIEIAPRGDHLAPGVRVADAHESLPREIRVARADVEVVRNEPFAAPAEADPSLDADDGVPVLGCDGAASSAGGS